MLRNSIMIASVAVIVLSIPARASECTSASEIAASHIRSATILSQPTKPAHNERICRAYATSNQLVTTRQNTASCIRSNDRQRDLALLDAEIEALNDALASNAAADTWL
ncbi:hypothetical protein QA640_45535 (plasmid) [Bradyrhizobium sp. CB82]|uniref:hypothetical protein n=1 Tax=Bradyrhizobium sp. CB82 TaxID=3039159 RepID=UPI0024B159F6|nr:hypothetical protein [Bradyrhizobium sp. CB82]WFU46034.1 hypothetical protein QA640_45535 [Bradyrhizobium sp. CB82]